MVEEGIAVGNPSLRPHYQRVCGLVATVVSMEPLGSEWATACSEAEQPEAPIFYGGQGACPLYERFLLLPRTCARPALLYHDDLPVDHWQL